MWLIYHRNVGVLRQPCVSHCNRHDVFVTVTLAVLCQMRVRHCNRHDVFVTVTHCAALDVVPPVVVESLSSSGPASPHCQVWLRFFSQHFSTCSHFRHTAAVFYTVYQPPPNRKNRLTDSICLDQFPEFLDRCNCLLGQLCIYSFIVTV